MKNIEMIKAYWMATMAMGETREEMEETWATEDGMQDLMDWFNDEIEAGLTEGEMAEAIKAVEEQKANAITYGRFIELARANYTKGGDSFYECWDERTFNDYVKMFGPVTEKKALNMFKDNAEVEAEYDAAARWGGGIDQETIDIINKENAEYEARMKAEEDKKMAKTSAQVEIIEIEVEGIKYTQTRPGYYYKRVDGKNVRIPKAEWEQAFDAYTDQVNEADEKIDLDDDSQTQYLDLEAEGATWDAEDEIRARKDLQEKKDREAEKAVNGKKTAKKARHPKDVAFEMDTLVGHITLTAKQVDFIKHLPDTNFWEQGLDSMPWCDVLADEIGGQFAGKPMTVGAMISTLREKHLIEVGRDTTRQGKPKYLVLTEVGKAVAKKLGLK